jgi:2-dehydro-3-deoxygalactonokinase
MAERTAMIGVDWGTSALRAFRLDGAGRLLERRAADRGILGVVADRFPEVLDEVVGDWRAPGMPVLLSGMIGSRQGWIEAPYCPLPAAPADIGRALVRVPADPLVRVVPGLARRPEAEAPEVMRGEETEILGTLEPDAADRRLLVMPGTHAKWVLVDDGRIVWFQTFMTGELFALLKAHSILGRLMTGEAPDEAAFAKGLAMARREPGGLLGRLFSARTFGLFEEIRSEALAAYLSGLLIGSEIKEALARLTSAPAAVTVIGAPALVERYLPALRAFGLEGRPGPENAAARGQFRIATAAGLIAPGPGAGAGGEAH